MFGEHHPTFGIIIFFVAFVSFFMSTDQMRRYGWYEEEP